jgi:hypothetical protein
MTEKRPITIKTDLIYTLTPTSITIGIRAGHAITRVKLDIQKTIYKKLLYEMQKPVFSLSLPATFSLTTNTYGDGKEYAYNVTFTKPEREPANRDNDKQVGNH